MGLLTSAKPLAPKTAAAKTGSLKHKVELKGLELYAELDTVEKTVCAVKKTLGAEINAEAMAEFMRLGANGVRPESFKGSEGNAEASMELRKRSSASVLTDEEIKVVQGAGLPVEVVITQEHMFGVDPKYSTDMDLLSKVEVALEGIIPDDFFCVQEKVSKTVVGDTTVAEAFAKKVSVDIVRMLTCQAIKPKLLATDMAKVLNDIKPHIVG